MSYIFCSLLFTLILNPNILAGPFHPGFFVARLIIYNCREIFKNFLNPKRYFSVDFSLISAYTVVRGNPHGILCNDVPYKERRNRMKSSVKRILAIAICLALLLAVAPTQTKKAAAAATVTKVTMKAKSTGKGRARFWVQGKTSSGKVVWTYKTRALVQTELDSANCKATKKYVYIVDNNLFIRLNKNTGKVLAKKKFAGKYGLYGATLKVDKKGNLYTIGYYNSTLYKINKNGKVLWKHSFPNDIYWAYKIELKNDKVYVTFDEGGVKSVSASTGK